MSDKMNSKSPQLAPQVVQDAQAMYNGERLEMKKDAAVIAEMAESTFRHRMAGQRSAEDYNQALRLLTAEEASVTPL